MNPASLLLPTRPAFALPLAAWCALAISLTGCVSLHSVRSEQKFSAPPVNADVCNYDWQVGPVLFRAEGAVSYPWDTLHRFGHPNTGPHVKQLAASCPRPSPARPATVSVYYLEHVNKTYHWSLLSAGRLVWAASLGTVPLPLFWNYAACVQVRSPDGLNRFAIAHGEISSVANLWGDGLGRDNIRSARSQRISSLLQDLTSQAWTKLWLEPTENLGAEDCRSRLDVLAGREPSKAPQSEVSDGGFDVKFEQSDRRENPPKPTADEWVSCFTQGERKWTPRSQCD
jgi:hypothetical protein